VAAVCVAEARVTSASAKRDKACAIANAWVAEANAGLDMARVDLARVSGVDRAAQLLGISKIELRRSLSSAGGLDGAA
jgi:hypothetical protein